MPYKNKPKSHVDEVNEKDLLVAAIWFDRMKLLVRKRRLDLGLNPTELGRLVGVSSTSINNVEKPGKAFNLSTYLKLCAVLGIEITLSAKPTYLDAERIVRVQGRGSITIDESDDEIIEKMKKKF